MVDKNKLRRKIKKNKPVFHRQEYTRHIAFEKGWRAPKGKHSKLRKGKKERGSVPSPGYGSPKDVKGFHPCGKKEVLVCNMKDAEKVDTNVVVRLSRKLGKKKKLEICRVLKEKGVTILNPVKDKLR